MLLTSSLSRFLRRRLFTLPSRTWRNGANCSVPHSIGESSTARFHREAGVERLRDLDGGGEERELRPRNGVRPVVAVGLGSENLTRFLVRCGVDGGVAIPCLLRVIFSL